MIWRGGVCNFNNAGVKASSSISAINSLSGFDHPTTTRIVEIEIPIVDAFEAGLFLYWITPTDVVCVLQPSLSLSNNRLHRVDGPAVRWPSRECYCFWQGVHVPCWSIEEPHRIGEEAASRPNYDFMFRESPVGILEEFLALPVSTGTPDT